MASNAAITVNTGTVVDSSAITNFDFAIGMVCAWLVPHLISTHRLVHRTLRRSPDWIERNVIVTDKAREAASYGYGNGDEKLASANRVANLALRQAIAVAFVFYIGVAILLSLMTRDMDYRTSYILKGISFFVGAFFIFLLSFKAPQWLAVYASLYEYQVHHVELGDDCISLQRRVRLQIYKTFLTVFPLMAPFFCGAYPATIPFSIIIGLTMGFFLCLTIDWGNRTIKKPKELVAFAIFVAVAFIFASAYLFSYGCGYVEDVWGDRQGKSLTLLDKLSFSLWIVGGVLIHVVVWYLSYLSHKGMEMETEVMDSQIKAVRPRPRTFFGTSVYNMQSMARGLDGDKSDRSFQSPASRRFTKPPQDGNNDTGNEHMAPLAEEDEDEEDSQEENDNETASEQPTASRIGDESIADASSLATPPLPPGPPPSWPQEEDEGEGYEQEAPDDNDTLDKANDVANVEPQEAAMNDDDLEDPQQQQSSSTDSRCHIVNQICCDLTCGQGGKTRSLAAKTYNCVSWFLWFVLFAASLFFIMIMVGSQYQENIVRDTLPYAEEILYSTINTGPQCAFYDQPVGINRNRTRRERVEATQTTFDTPQEAHLAGYTILHCGACAKCSNWHDLRLEYTTRNILGPVALECAKKSLWGGGVRVLKECTMEKTTFQEPCAECWAVDMACTRRHCMWIGLRSFMINTVTNLQVGADDITPATCEEAMCEATEITGYEGFVPCSGATRRRMNVVSTIKRPEHQQCHNVGVKWEEFFGPSEGNLDYDPSYDDIIDLHGEDDEADVPGADNNQTTTAGLANETSS